MFNIMFRPNATQIAGGQFPLLSCTIYAVYLTEMCSLHKYDINVNYKKCGKY